mmetsp:Transcript_56652/g.112657  ORF Transcript_56652/g.112657 Transcript_56652/m.112657 type:complete len:86 (-) Transcript_56652:330-587(-)
MTASLMLKRSTATAMEVMVAVMMEVMTEATGTSAPILIAPMELATTGLATAMVAAMATKKHAAQKDVTILHMAQVGNPSTSMTTV